MILSDCYRYWTEWRYKKCHLDIGETTSTSVSEVLANFPSFFQIETTDGNKVNTAQLNSTQDGVTKYFPISTFATISWMQSFRKSKIIKKHLILIKCDGCTNRFTAIKPNQIKERHQEGDMIGNMIKTNEKRPLKCIHIQHLTITPAKRVL